MRHLNPVPEYIPVLLTSSVIAYDTGVALKDTETRLLLALQSIEEWLAIEPDQPLVLCDGSSFDFAPLIAEKFPNRRIECLHFENDQEKVRQLGRGYGEGEIVRHALNHSQFITEAGCFAKCSSKLWVQNFKACRENWNGAFLCKGVFLNVFSPFKKTEFSYIDTRFYISDVSFYRRHLMDAHLKIDRTRGKALENCFYEIITQSGIEQVLLPVAPVISGVGGGIGKRYKDSWKRRMKEDLRVWWVRRKKSYSPFFAQHGN